MLFFMIGFLASVVGALSGLGGGIIIKPVLDAATNLDSSVISFLSTATVFSMAVTSAIRHVKYKTKFDTITLFLGIGGMAGGFLGTALFNAVLSYFEKDQFIKILQNGILLFILIIITVYLNLNKKKQFNLKHRLIVTLIGMLLGTISSFLGIGGGPINLAALTLFFSMDLRMATANSILLILFSQASKLTATFISGTIPENIHYSNLWWMVLAAIIGGFLGTKLNKVISTKYLKFAYNAVMLFVISTCIYNIFQLL